MTTKKIGKFTLEKNLGGWVCNQVGHFFYDLYQAENYLDDLEDKIDRIVGTDWDDVIDVSKGFKVLYKGKVLGVFPINTDLDSWIDGID